MRRTVSRFEPPPRRALPIAAAAEATDDGGAWDAWDSLWRGLGAGDPRAPALWRLRPWLVRPHRELRSEPPHLSGRHALEQSRTGAT